MNSVRVTGSLCEFVSRVRKHLDLLVYRGRDESRLVLIIQTDPIPNYLDTNMSDPLTPLRDMNLGSIPLTSPRQQRYRQNRRSTLSGEAINAIHINNALVGDTGTQIPVPDPARTLFSPTPTVPQGSSSTGAQPTSSTQAASGTNSGPSGNPFTPVPQGRVITIGGVAMTLASSPADKDTFTVTKLWDKTARKTLDAEQLQVFVKAATGFVLSRTNKLAILSTKTDDDGILKHVHNLRSQLKVLEDHLVNYDLADVFTIVSVNNLETTGDLNASPDGKGPLVHNLFQDYSRLHKAEVANSNAWYHTWLAPDQPYVKENLKLSFEFLQKNTDDTLWGKCLEEYEEYHPIQQGGPLMLYLILRRIQNSSEDAVEFLKKKVTTVRISKIDGENVETVVSLIKSAYYALLGASTSTRSYVPDDFPCSVLRVMQTSSNAKFNATFRHEEDDARRYADKFGGQPNWPSITQTLNQATNTYRRLLQSGDWETPAKRQAHVADLSSTSGPPRKKPFRCFNCGKDGHGVSTCPDPPDPARIKRNRDAFLEAKKSQFGTKPQHKIAKDGRKLVLNATTGYYVHDVAADAKAAKNAEKRAKRNEKQAAKLAEKAAATATALVSRLQLLPTSAPASEPAVPANQATPPVASDTPTAFRSALRDALLADFRES